jgi:raffinose/stachyose/melibiose transport system permease protein
MSLGKLRRILKIIPTHAALMAWSALVLIPIWLLLINSLKVQSEIFQHPFALPDDFVLSGYINAWTRGRFDVFFRNTIFVTFGALFLILFFGSLAGYALAVWKSRFSDAIYIFFIAGLMLPMRLGTINLLQILKALHLTDGVVGLLPIYVAMGLPIATFILTPFIRALPRDLLDAARIDGASEWHLYRTIVLPIIRPALATVLILNVILIWNDLWFPLIMIRGQEHRTIIYGVSLLFGQYMTDWTTALAMLAMSSIPVLILYLVLARQFIVGLTTGAVKG